MNLFRTPRAALVILALCPASLADAEQPGAGVVIGIRGMPMSIDATGMTRRARALQDIADGERIVLEAGDVVTLCLQAREGFEVAGPGSVSVGTRNVVTVLGSPRVVRKGPCEVAGEADSDGGVILRHMFLHRQTQGEVGR